jgi:hypothetical protein
MRLDPALEEPGRNRKVHALLLYGFQIHPRKPACIDVFPDRRTQPALHARPTILFHICHCLTAFLKKSDYWPAKSPSGVCERRTSSGCLGSRHRPAARQARREANQWLERKVGEVSEYSADCPALWAAGR